MRGFTGVVVAAFLISSAAQAGKVTAPMALADLYGEGLVSPSV